MSGRLGLSRMIWRMCFRNSYIKPTIKFPSTFRETTVKEFLKNPSKINHEFDSLYNKPNYLNAKINVGKFNNQIKTEPLSKTTDNIFSHTPKITEYLLGRTFILEAISGSITDAITDVISDAVYKEYNRKSTIILADTNYVEENIGLSYAIYHEEAKSDVEEKKDGTRYTKIFNSTHNILSSVESKEKNDEIHIAVTCRGSVIWENGKLNLSNVQTWWQLPFYGIDVSESETGKGIETNFPSFNVIKDELANEIDNVIKNNPNKKKIKITFTGHSLGGVLAWLSLIHIDSIYSDKNIQMEYVGFATPRSANASFNEAIKKLEEKNRKMLLVQVSSDPVPRLTGVQQQITMQDYKAGHTWIVPNASFTLNPKLIHSIANYKNSVCAWKNKNMEKQP